MPQPPASENRFRPGRVCGPKRHSFTLGKERHEQDPNSRAVVRRGRRRRPRGRDGVGSRQARLAAGASDLDDRVREPALDRRAHARPQGQPVRPATGRCGWMHDRADRPGGRRRIRPGSSSRGSTRPAVRQGWRSAPTVGSMSPASERRVTRSASSHPATQIPPIPPLRQASQQGRRAPTASRSTKTATSMSPTAAPRRAASSASARPAARRRCSSAFPRWPTRSASGVRTCPCSRRPPTFPRDSGDRRERARVRPRG